MVQRRYAARRSGAKPRRCIEIVLDPERSGNVLVMQRRYVASGPAALRWRWVEPLEACAKKGERPALMDRPLPSVLAI